VNNGLKIDQRLLVTSSPDSVSWLPTVRPELCGEDRNTFSILAAYQCEGPAWLKNQYFFPMRIANLPYTRAAIVLLPFPFISMRPSLSFLPLAALLLGSLSLSSCGGRENGTSTSTPTSTLGTESNASKVGGTDAPMGAPADGTGSASTNGMDTGNSMNGGGSGSSGTSNTGATMGNSPAASAGTPTSGGPGASGTTNGTGAK
jgi:hypothetical protein